MVRLTLDEADVDIILSLLSRKIEKAAEKEIDEAQVQYLKELKSLKSDIETQISI